jgi:hypothetical protein
LIPEKAEMRLATLRARDHHVTARLDSNPGNQKRASRVETSAVAGEHPTPSVAGRYSGFDPRA